MKGDIFLAYIPNKLIEQKLLHFLQEDIEYGDITGELVPNIPVLAKIYAKQDCTLCGIKFTQILLNSFNIKSHSFFKDGDNVKNGDTVLKLKGLSRDILVLERTILNLLMRLSGIATYTQKLVKIVKNSNLNIKIASTRKTTPGLRYFEKYAVKVGGGDPHRWSLSDTILIKENHLKLFQKDSIKTILAKSQNNSSFTKKIDIEVENLKELTRALTFLPEIIMLDDFSVEDIKKAIQIIQQKQEGQRPLIEISGGISEKNINDYLISGIDILSIGALTHAAKSIDFTLKIKKIIDVKTEK